jgi:hypothetical protein
MMTPQERADLMTYINSLPPRERARLRAEARARVEQKGEVTPQLVAREFFFLAWCDLIGNQVLQEGVDRGEHVVSFEPQADGSLMAVYHPTGNPTLPPQDGEEDS